MADPMRYVELMASLPSLGSTWDVKRPAINRIKLDQRLRLLLDEDAARLKRIENLLHWNNLPMGLSDTEFLDAAQSVLAELGDPDLRAIVEGRLEARTFVAALRRRALGKHRPEPRERWGFGPWVDTIRRKWQEPAFGLERVFPRLADANTLLQNGDTVGLDRLLTDQAWRALGQHGENHEFDFVAVVVYVLKWDLIERRLRQDPQQAALRFEQLATEALGERAELAEIRS